MLPPMSITVRATGLLLADRESGRLTLMMVALICAFTRSHPTHGILRINPIFASKLNSIVFIHGG